MQIGLGHLSKNRKLPIQILGSGTNVVLSKDIAGGVLKVSIPGKKIHGDEIIVGAGENWHQIVLWSLKNGLYGLENLSLITLLFCLVLQ